MQTSTLALLGLSLLTACAGPRELTVQTNPSGAAVALDGIPAGTAPLRVRVASGSHVLTASLEGYTTVSRTITDDDQGAIKLLLGKAAGAPAPRNRAPLLEATTTSEATNTWLRLPSATPRDAAWRAIVTSLRASHGELEQLDKRAGSLTTAPKTADFGPVAIRSQIQVRTASASPPVFELQIKSESRRPGGAWRPYTRVFKRDAEVLARLREQLAKTPR